MANSRGIETILCYTGKHISLVTHLVLQHTKQKNIINIYHFYMQSIEIMDVKHLDAKQELV